jgi:hypothetical protein
VPAGNDDVVIFNAGALIRIERAAFVEREPLSVTLTVKPDVPAAVGVPEIVLPARVNPAGSDPLATDQVYGGVPPDAFSVCEYPTPTVPAGNDEVLMFNAGALIVSDSPALADPEALSVTLTVKLDDPAAVGVPEIVPPARFSPAGSDPVTTDHVYGGDPPVALSACEYPTPTIPTGNEEVVIASVGALIAIDNGAFADTDAASVTLTVKFDDPAAVGVPEIVFPEIPSPAGSDPVATDHI